VQRPVWYSNDVGKWRWKVVLFDVGLTTRLKWSFRLSGQVYQCCLSYIFVITCLWTISLQWRWWGSLHKVHCQEDTYTLHGCIGVTVAEKLDEPHMELMLILFLFLLPSLLALVIICRHCCRTNSFYVLSSTLKSGSFICEPVGEKCLWVTLQAQWNNDSHKMWRPGCSPWILYDNFTNAQM